MLNIATDTQEVSSEAAATHAAVLSALKKLYAETQIAYKVNPSSWEDGRLSVYFPDLTEKFTEVRADNDVKEPMKAKTTPMAPWSMSVGANEAICSFNVIDKINYGVRSREFMVETFNPNDPEALKSKLDLVAETMVKRFGPKGCVASWKPLDMQAVPTRPEHRTTFVAPAPMGGRVIKLFTYQTPVAPAPEPK